MAINFAVDLECEPKRFFGEGNCQNGKRIIEKKLAALDKAQTIRDMAREAGDDPYEIRVKLEDLKVHQADENPVGPVVGLADVEEEAKGLDGHSAQCGTCPVNVRKEPFGCFCWINYPIPESAEKWLISRLQPPGTFGGGLCYHLVRGSGCSGRTVRAMREAGALSARLATKVKVMKGLLGYRSVTSDQIIEYIFGPGELIEPMLCFDILLFFGAIRVDGTIPAHRGDKGMLGLGDLSSREAKAQRTSLEVGSDSDAEKGMGFENLFKVMYLSWVHGVPASLSW